MRVGSRPLVVPVDGLFTRLAHLARVAAPPGVAGGISPKEALFNKFGDALKAIKSFVGSPEALVLRLSGMGGWGGMMRQMTESVVNGVGTVRQRQDPEHIPAGQPDSDV